MGPLLVAPKGSPRFRDGGGNRGLGNSQFGCGLRHAATFRYGEKHLRVGSGLTDIAAKDWPGCRIAPPGRIGFGSQRPRL